LFNHLRQTRFINGESFFPTLFFKFFFPIHLINVSITTCSVGIYCRRGFLNSPPINEGATFIILQFGF
jgi:hypothetical protein